MKKIFTLLSLCFISNSLVAHPHAFLDMKTHVLVEDGKLHGFNMTWILDEITSSELIYQIKRSDNEKAETKKITDELTASSVGAHYFSELYDQDKKPIKFKAQPKNPHIEIKNHQVLYHFGLILSKPQEVKDRSFNLFTFEPSYYLYMGYANAKDVTITQQNWCTVSMQDPKADQSMQLYASSLDKNDSPNLPMDNGLSLGAIFAQKVAIKCQ